jgi:hypothetical protein
MVMIPLLVNTHSGAAGYTSGAVQQAINGMAWDNFAQLCRRFAAAVGRMLPTPAMRPDKPGDKSGTTKTLSTGQNQKRKLFIFPKHLESTGVNSSARSVSACHH